MSQSIPVQDNNLWRKIFLIACILIVIIMPLLSKDYGQSGDEWLEMEYGRDIYNYFFEGDKQALDYSSKSTQYQGMQLYGGLFNYYTEIIHRMMPGIPVQHVKHFFNSLTGAILMIFTGLLAFRLSKKWSVAVIALLFIFFSPRIFGESMNNPKDIPHAMGFMIGIYGLVALLQDYPRKLWRNVMILAVGFGITFGQRPAGGMLQGCYIVLFIAVYYYTNNAFKETLLADNKKLLKKLVLALVAALVIGYIIGLSAWPYGIESPIAHPLESLKAMTNRDIIIRVLFEGEYWYNNNLPWYYEFKWISISNPLAVIAGVLLFLVLVFKAIKSYGVFAVVVVLFGAFFPLLYMIYKESTVYDTWRHVFFVYGFWVVMAALGWDLLTTFISNVKYRQLVPIVAILALTPAIAWTVRSHPNQYVYFNELQGGPAGAVGYYDLDYYQNTGKQAADWIIKNVKPTPGKKIHTVSNMLGFDKYYAKDTSWLSELYGRYNERHHLEWDYYITYGRFIPPAQLQNGKWPPANVVHVIEEDGAVLAAIIQRKSRAGIAAYDSLQKNNFPAAARLYEEYLKTDNTDENVYLNYAIALASMGNLDGAVAALNNAIQLDPGNAQFYDILSKIHQSRGDMAGAQAAKNTANAIMMEEQERVKPQKGEE